jgi:hypothetical protein
LPFLRVVRDKRGYETTYLMHWFREGHRQRSRILYVFRTPPGVRVGRDPLDPAVIREIEAQHPDIDFDWATLVDNQQVVEVSAEPRRPQKRGRPEPPQMIAPSAPVVETVKPAPVQPPEVQHPDVAEPAVHAVPRTPIPAVIEGTTRDEQMAFLRTWYPQIRERVPHRTHDPVRIDALLALAERLNPNAWGDEEQIAVGLTHAAEALARLSRVFAKRRRRARRRPAAASGGDRVEARASEHGTSREPSASVPPDAVAEGEPETTHEGPADDGDASDE